MVDVELSLARLLNDKVVIGLKGKNREEVIKELTKELVACDKIQHEEKLVEEIFKRENLASTGIGFGIAIPHIRCGFVKEPHLIAGISHQGVDFKSIDGRPVHLVFLLIAPKNHSDYNIEILSRLASVLQNKGTREKLANAESVDSFVNTLKEAEENPINHKS